ncbi:MAG: UDP-N-acetylmuramate--L-alanine ligase [Anaerolineae bacterium]|nr:UDP-N-acetylmuramate--L-alanine ligase [Anaerolineae bacterium]MDW8100961.1 UDP-N-acetylmuramate--L-alanine ligase [Anaerolineae bacterium]
MSVPSAIPLATPEMVVAILDRPNAHIHLVGIGGAGLSAIATILLERGYRVSGSDLMRTPTTERLEAAGATIYIGQAAGQVAGADLVLISSAVRPENPELQSALAAGIPVVKRAQFLGALMHGKIGIAVAGTHGKTTTTAMIATTLLAAGHDPDFIVGGTVLGLECNARAGRGRVFVIEADEYDRMFLGLSPQVAVVTNVEWDHVDCYPTPADFVKAFQEFVQRLPEDGLLVACADDPGARALAEARQAFGRPAITYGLGGDSLWQARTLCANQHGGIDSQVWHAGVPVAELRLRIPGHHNVRNALACLAVASHFGISPEIAAAHLSNFAGVRRRFEVKGMKHDIIVIDDYAHHPSEVQATLAGARQRYPDRTIWVVFQPHTYSRTRALLSAFANCFAEADHVLITDVYAAREHDTLGVHAAQLAEAARQTHPDVRYIGGLNEAAEILLADLRPGDVLLTLGAGDGYQVGERVLAALDKRSRG